jgi:hypothetical protein
MRSARAPERAMSLNETSRFHHCGEELGLQFRDFELKIYGAYRTVALSIRLLESSILSTCQDEQFKVFH